MLAQGTEPPTSLAGIAGGSAAEPDYEAMDEEHRRLLGVIRQARTCLAACSFCTFRYPCLSWRAARNRRALGCCVRQAGTGEAEAVRAEPKDVVVVRAQLPTGLDRDQRRAPGAAAGDDQGAAAPQITLRLFVTYTVRPSLPAPLKACCCVSDALVGAHGAMAGDGRYRRRYAAPGAALPSALRTEQRGAADAARLRLWHACYGVCFPTQHASHASILSIARPCCCPVRRVLRNAMWEGVPATRITSRKSRTHLWRLLCRLVYGPLQVPVVLLASKEALPGSRELGVSVCYTTSAGEPRTAVVWVALPLCLFVVAVPPVKAARFKLTLDTNRPPPVLTSLFEELGHAAAQSNAVSFQFWCGDEVTIIVSKSAGRYRLQSNQSEALWLLAEELQQRLRVYFAAETAPPPGEGPLAFSCAEALPLEELSALVEAHFAARQAVGAATRQLEERAAQLRAVQKRLLMRYKDKTPQPLAELSQLLEGAFRQLQEAGVAVERAQREARRHHARVQARDGRRFCTLLYTLLRALLHRAVLCCVPCHSCR